jgi:Uroporphyrinogen decarboxylase (URO-D)
MNKEDQFDTSLADSQATSAHPLKYTEFDISAYSEYEQQLLETCQDFWKCKSGVLVYRRMRIAEVFSYGCKNMQKSLEWQLGALQQSMEYKADIPNFLEPWYGIGTVASAFGRDYVWHANQAPAIAGKFSSTKEALEYDFIPVNETKIGKHTLQMVEYFLEKTMGRIPISYCDMQSPLNVAENLVDINAFMTDFLQYPDSVKALFEIISDLMIDFTQMLGKLIGNALASPGHGFASSRRFDGLGMSDDLFIMLPDDLYQEIAVPGFEKTSIPFNNSAFHSCGNWSKKIPVVKQIKGLKMIDAAFSKATDPNPNPVEDFSKSFANTGIIVNARIVGGLDVIEEKVRKLWHPGMKLIVVTYCQTIEEQVRAYDMIHEICQ